ncbi:hypothetical protein ALC57_12076, partial [Trachymyrmex cornetzi]
LRTGVIRDIPVDLEDETVKRHLISQNKIIEVNRLMRRTTKDGKSEITPSKSLCIKFAGQSLPKYVSLFYTRHAVSTFIPKVRICYNCFRAGHISKSCRGNARCTDMILNSIQEVLALTLILTNVRDMILNSIQEVLAVCRTICVMLMCQSFPNRQRSEISMEVDILDIQFAVLPMEKELQLCTSKL